MYEQKNTPDPIVTKENILVTGGSGLVGSELIAQLVAAGNKVKAAYHTTPLPDFKSDNITPVECDILDTCMLEDTMQGITKVYHCAAIVSFSRKDKHKVAEVNIEGTTNIVNACLNAGVKKLLHVSSVAALGKAAEGGYITEETGWRGEQGDDFYGRSKFLGEMEVWRGIGEGLEAVIVNPSTILGAHDWNRGSTQIFKNAYEEFAWYSEGVTGFVDVRDVASAMILLMDNEIVNQRFILNAENLSYKTLFSQIAAGFGKRPPYRKVTPLLAALVWRLEAVKSFITGRPHLLNRETARKALSKYNFDNSKIKKTLKGFSFRPVSETINDTCTALQELNPIF